MKLFLTLVLGHLLLCPFTASAQSPTLIVDGTVKESGKRLSGAAITVMRNGTQFDKASTAVNGKFSFELNLGFDYMLIFSKLGYVTKKININTKDIPSEEATFGFSYGGWEVGLFQEIEGLDVSILKKPVGKIRYDAKLGSFDHDEAYTKSIQAELTRLQKELIKRDNAYKKEITDGDRAFNAKDYANAIAAYDRALELKPIETYPKNQIKKSKQLLVDMIAQQKEQEALEQAYKDAISKGDAAFSGKKYKDAKQSYNAALAVKPAEAYPKNKISEINKILAGLVTAEAREKAKEERYQSLIKSSDQAFNSKQYAGAKSNYQAASDIFPDRPYPKERIAEIDKIVAEQAKSQEIDAAYNKAVAKADADFKAKRYESAKAEYLTAEGIKPLEQYPKDQIAEIDKLLAKLAKTQAQEEAYKAAIAKADKGYSEKEYGLALADYKEASGMKPDEQYPKDKITEINKLLADKDAAAAAQKAKDEKYNGLISSADAAFNSKQYGKAKADYQAALAVKPKEKYPINKITEIDKLIQALAGAKALEEQYNRLIASAGKAFNAEKYLDARKDYQTATGLKPSESHPKERIAEIDKILNKQASVKELEERYKTLIASADKDFGIKQYNRSKIDYQAATELKPGEQYPKDRIAEIDKLLDVLAATAEIEKKYKGLIDIADKAFRAKEYETAKTNYQSASGVKPDEQYPKNRITEIDKLIGQLANAAEREVKYNELIAGADKLFAEKKYKDSRADYRSALNIKPGEKYPVKQIEEIDRILGEFAAKLAAEEKAKNELYRKALGEADFYFKTKDYKNSRIKYNQALTIKPDEQYPKDQLTRIEQLESVDLSKTVNEEKYNALIASADKAFGTSDYGNAKRDYRAALGLKPHADYPKRKIQEINMAIKDRIAQEKAAKARAERMALLEKQRQAAMRHAEKNQENKEISPEVDEFINELAKKYPPGITEHEFKEDRMTILRRVVVIDNKGYEYKRVTHGWGGRFYFKNGSPITELVWKQETSPDVFKQ